MVEKSCHRAVDLQASPVLFFFLKPETEPVSASKIGLELRVAQAGLDSKVMLHCSE